MSAYTTVEDLAGRAYEFVPDGVYLGLEERLYFGQDAIGSSDLIRLYKHRHGWWWQSRWNPDHVDRPGPERNYGSATHVIVLESVAAYERRFAVQPTCPPGALKTIGDVKAALEGAGLSTRGTSGWVAAEWFRAADINLPDLPCWPNMLEEFDRDRAERPFVSAVEDRMLRIMHAAAVDNPAISTLLQDTEEFPALAEVSILKTLPDGTRRRWRLDRLFPQFTMDLKTLGNWSGRPLRFAVGDHIGRNGYEIQRADYDDGRRALNAFVRDGFQVYGGTLEQRDWLRRLVDMSPSWDWVWLFYQKPEPTGRAPVIFPVYDDSDSDLARWGAARAAKALTFYREMMASFGPMRPWTSVEPLHYTVEQTKKPFITLPHWIGEDDPADPAAYEDASEEGAN